MNRLLLSLLICFATQISFSQNATVLTLEEYLGYVKKYHPIVKQANLLLSESEAKLLKSRGAFDPKIEVDYDRKKFEGTEYYDKLNTVFKIPTWYGVEFKGSFEDNSGVYLNPEATLPTDGLYSVGVSVSLAKGFLINERMAAIKQAKQYQLQAEKENQLLVNDVLFQATIAYFNWVRTHGELEVYTEFLTNAELRLNGIKRSYELGENPAIDITEAQIAYNNRKLNLEKANLNYTKAALALSNFLWINDVPAEIQNNVTPETEVAIIVDNILEIQSFEKDQNTIVNHPKLQSLEYKISGLEIEKRLQKNNLLPSIDLQYNFLSETPGTINSFNTDNYKAGVAVKFPIFLRKERADLKLTKYKLDAINFEKSAIELELNNKLKAIEQEIDSYENQLEITNNIVADYTILLKGEERKFDIGESSLFLINSREAKLIENKLKALETENQLLNAKGKLFNILAIN
ncbi:TolC family protein [Urechidicola sp. KH5]